MKRKRNDNFAHHMDGSYGKLILRHDLVVEGEISYRNGDDHLNVNEAAPSARGYLVPLASVVAYEWGDDQ